MSYPRPCNSCPVEKRDACWKSEEYACEAFYNWLRGSSETKAEK